MSGSAPGALGTGAPPLAVELATWPPLRTHDVDGWRVGVSGGFTRRANSAVPWAPVPDVGATLDRVEAVYRAASLPVVLRVGAGARPEGLERVLDERGYLRVARTALMVRPVPGDPSDGVLVGASVPAAAHGLAPAVLAADEPDVDWLRTWTAVKSAGADLDLARAVVTGAPARYLTARDDDGVLGVVRAAVHEGWVAVSCLMVVPRARRRRVASALTRAALAEGARLGARWGLVQVEVANEGARALYARHGFVAVEEYDYRELRG